MIFSYNWLQSFFEKTLPSPEELAELLTQHVFEVEEIKKEGGDYTLDIDVMPNRAGDCFSHYGIAREIAAITKLKLSPLEREVLENEAVLVKNYVKVEVKGKDMCSRYTARAMIDVRVTPSPKWLQEKLMVCGLRPINNIVDIANYVMLETGQPLHAFDGDKLENRKLLVRFAKKKERIVTLDEEKYDLDTDILVIADTQKPVAIAGIKGGKFPEIDIKTKTIVIEAANFNQSLIRKASKKINLKTDASWRFEHGIDPNLTEIAINRTVRLIQEVAGGKIAAGLVDIYPRKVLPKKVRLEIGAVAKLLGIEIPKKEIIRILTALAFKIKAQRKNSLDVQIPTQRLDVSIPEDLIEEIGRIYGYQKIKPAFPLSSLIPPKKNINLFWEDLTKNILREVGFTEVYNYSFVSERDIRNFGGKNAIELENPISEDHKYLRTSLIPGLLKNIQANQKNFKQIKIYELGRVFEKTKSITEQRALAAVLTGETFYFGKGIVDLLLKKLGISNVFYDEYQVPVSEVKGYWWHPKKIAEIKVDGERIGFLGSISPRILDELKLESEVIYFDIDFEKLSKSVTEEHEYRPISRYPAAVRDLAVLVPREIKVVELLNIINIAGGELIRDVDLFDIYEGRELPQQKKNLAFHIIYQAENKTLSSGEIDDIQTKVIKALEKNPGWQIRK